MTFIVILIALLVERFFDWSHLRYVGWVDKGMTMVSNKLPAQSPYAGLSLFILPLLIVILLADFFLYDVLYGFARLIFQLVIMIYCLGPKNLWADSFACVHALTQGDAQFAADKLKSAFGIADVSDESKLQSDLVHSLFDEANKRVFAVVFWFVVLGPFGALLYRALSEVARATDNNEQLARYHEVAHICVAALDWLPIRVFTFLFALGGQFVQVLNAWRKSVLLGLVGNHQLLEDCGDAALGNDGEKEKVKAKAVVALLDRVFIIALVLIAVVDVLL